MRYVVFILIEKEREKKLLKTVFALLTIFSFDKREKMKIFAHQFTE